MILDIQSVNVGVENGNVSVSHTPNQAQLKTLMIVRSMVRMVIGMVMMMMMMVVLVIIDDGDDDDDGADDDGGDDGDGWLVW